MRMMNIPAKLYIKKKNFGPIFSVSCTINVEEIVFVV